MTNTADQDRVLARIRKMLALANDAAASDGERENAMRMVHATLAKHNLSMAEAEAAGSSEEKREAGNSVSRDQPWARHVAHSIASLFFCRYYFSRTAKKGTVQHNFIGRASNVVTASEMTTFVIKSIMSEANRGWKSQPNPGPWWTSFCKGAADRIAERCAELKAAAEKSSAEDAKTTGTALVLASFYKTELEANTKYINEVLGLRLKVAAAREKRVGAGYADGKAFGGSINLNRQVGTSPAARRLTT